MLDTMSRNVLGEEHRAAKKTARCQAVSVSFRLTNNLLQDPVAAVDSASRTRRLIDWFHGPLLALTWRIALVAKSAGVVSANISSESYSAVSDPRSLSLSLSLSLYYIYVNPSSQRALH